VISVDAEYDGQVLIPREPLNLSVGQKVRVTITDVASEKRIESLESALYYFQTHPVRRSLTDEELRREVIYEG